MLEIVLFSQNTVFAFLLTNGIQLNVFGRNIQTIKLAFIVGSAHIGILMEKWKMKMKIFTGGGGIP